MKPLNLIISAFGPYAKEQEIDFTKLNGRNVFLVTGVTGAGKTTIFDAISYALFGEASGTSREASSLRSDFADDSVQTYVELQFQVKDKIYTIRRSPEQQLKKKRGEGTTKKSSSVELELPDGKPLTKFNEVQEAIREIIGVDKDQFRQIVMLPQGEFRKLLESGSKEREEIFRKIFGTQAFLSLQQKLRERKKSLESELEITRSNRLIYVQSLKVPENKKSESIKISNDIDIKSVIEEVEVLEKQDLMQIKELIDGVNTVKENINIINNKISLANENNSKVNKKISFETKLKDLNLQKNEIENKNIILEKGNRALEIKNIEDEFNNLKNKLMLREKEVEEAKIRENRCSSELKQAIKILSENKEKEIERERLRNDIAKLSPYKDKLKQYELKKQSIEKLNGELKSLKEKRKILEVSIDRIKKELEEIINYINIGSKAEGELKALESEIKNQIEIKDSLRDLYRNFNDYFKLENEYKMKENDFNKQEKVFFTKRNEFQEKENLFRKGQAGILAENLPEGIPCPVCGSTAHPNKSKKLSGVPSEDELNKLKELKEEEEKKYNELLINLGELKAKKESSLEESIEAYAIRLKATLGEKFFELINNKEKQDYVTKIGSELKDKIESRKKEVEKLKSNINRKNESGKLKPHREGELKQLEQNLNITIDYLTQKSSQLAGETGLLNEIQREIPENLRDLNVVEEQIRKLSYALEISKKELELAQNKEKEASSQNTSAKEIKIEREKQQIKAKEEVDICEKNLNCSIIKEGFSDFNEYKKYLKSKNELGIIQKEISAYNQALSNLEAVYKQAIKEAKGLIIVDTDSLELSLKELKTNEEEILKNINILKNRVEINKENLKEIKKITKGILDKEEEYRVIAELEGVAYGDKNNLKKITFESYVLTSYFDEIIAAANVRLDKMSMGRFELKRKEDLGKGNKKQGLDLEVLDYHTGKARDVKTLSGGEGFKASLSLALGLADIIQSYAGGISIDTMFVDEGFGTLDVVSLDNAIECLLSLQQGGRLVGIISHVPELKERIDAILEVKTDKEGSCVQFNL